MIVASYMSCHMTSQRLASLHDFYKSHTYTPMHTNTHTYTHTIATYIPIVVTRIEDVRGPSPAPVLHETSIM